MTTTLCAFCTLPADRVATVNGKHYPRLCAKHQREVYIAPEAMPPVMEHDDASTGPEPTNVASQP